MNARYYVGAIGRFASADTIVPNPANPQSLNRYSYVRNSPLNLVDPTGHEEICGDIQCTEPPPPPPPPPIPTEPMVTFNVVDGCTSPVAGACEWSQAEMDTITAAAIVTGTKLAETLNAAHPGWNLTEEEAFLLVYGGPVSFLKMGGIMIVVIGGKHSSEMMADMKLRFMGVRNTLTAMFTGPFVTEHINEQQLFVRF